MQTVIETPAFMQAARRARLTAGEVSDIVTFIAARPDGGDAIVGTGGCRKVRIARRGEGKSGGYRLITFFSGKDIPVFLLTIFAKNEKGNLTKAERNALGVLTKQLVQTYREGRK